jgi:hypothetical protein
MKLTWPGALALGLVTVAGIGVAARAIQSETNAAESAELSPDLDQGNSAAPTPTRPTRVPTPPLATSDTPMGERVAVLGVLRKRDGYARDITLKPGQAAKLGPLIVRLRACDQTADWEPEQLTGAFVQTDLQGRDGQWRRIFSGWLYKESPSLNVVENPLYDVWPKSCAMRHAETGPATVSSSAAVVATRSIAKKSAAPTEAKEPVAVEPSPSASSNSAT